MWLRIHFRRYLPDTWVRHLVSPSPVPQPSLANPHNWQAPAQNAALLEESTRIWLDPSEWRGECPENGALEPRSHGTFLHVARQTRRQPSQLHYISQDHHNAHELTNHIRHPSPEPGLLSPGAPGKWWHRWCGIVPVTPTGTNGIFSGYSELVLSTESDFVVELVYNSRTNWSQQT